MDVVSIEEETLHSKPNMMQAATTTGLVELESFKFLRVLLVEFDDCTRSIISALLRKSGYRVVSVPDGFKAWEILKASPKNIDLVLAEVELPSISGFSLLGMIMDDDICRNIPVIMMSPCDSVNIVYKCMLRGAADFLVKPVRKNELRNLWQHVWRRHSGSSLGQCDEKRGFSQKQIEAIDESSSTKSSNHCVKSPKENRDSSDKGSDSQSSCTKPNMEDDTDVKDDGAMLINDNDAEDQSVKLTCEAVSCIPNNYSTSLMQEEGHADARRMSPVKDSTQETQEGDAYVEIKPFYRNDEQQPKSSKEAMDLIGSFDTHLNVHSTHSKEVDNSTVKNCCSAPGLELSLRRSNFNDNEIQGVAEIQTLNHSNASAFSRYNQRTLYRPVCSEKKNSATLTCNKADATINHTAEIPQHGPISATLPITGFDGAYSGYGAAWPQLVYTSAGPLPVQSPKSVTQQEAIFQMYSSDQSNVKNHDHQQYNRKYTDGIVHQKRLYVESFDDYRHFSVPSTTQSFTSSLCNSSSSNFNSSGCGSVCDGSNGNESTAPITGASTERGNDMGVIMPDRINGSDTNCSSQREAALHKFRLKRKDRCFDKKVRYQSRKRLAEQRPRVKGQFVRQIPS